MGNTINTLRPTVGRQNAGVYAAPGIDREISQEINSLPLWEWGRGDLEHEIIRLRNKLRVYELKKTFTEVEEAAFYVVRAEYPGLSLAAMKTKSRKRELVEPRQLMMYLLAEYTRMSLKNIGNLFGGRDHSTVIHARDTIKDLEDTSKVHRVIIRRARENFMNILSKDNL